MISGSLFLSKKEITIDVILEKYISRLVIAFIVWSLVYALYEAKMGTSLFFDKLITGSYHLWFIFMMIGVYLFIPISRKIVSDAECMKIFVVGSIVLIFGERTCRYLTNDFLRDSVKSIILPALDNLQSISIGIFSIYITYFILGYYFSTVSIKKSNYC